MKVLTHHLEFGFLPADAGAQRNPITGEIGGGGQGLGRIERIPERQNVDGGKKVQGGGGLCQGGSQDPGVRPVGLRVPEDIAAVTVQVFVHLVLGGYQVVTVGNPVKADLLAELRQFHHLVHFHECE